MIIDYIVSLTGISENSPYLDVIACILLCVLLFLVYDFLYCIFKWIARQ